MMRQSEFYDLSLKKLQRPGKTILVGTFLAPFFLGFLLFLSAGRVNIPRAWFLLALSLIGVFGQIAIVAVKDPELVNHRGLWKRKKTSNPGINGSCAGTGLCHFI